MCRAPELFLCNIAYFAGGHAVITEVGLRNTAKPDHSRRKLPSPLGRATSWRRRESTDIRVLTRTFMCLARRGPRPEVEMACQGARGGAAHLDLAGRWARCHAFLCLDVAPHAPALATFACHVVHGHGLDAHPFLSDAPPPPSESSLVHGMEN